MSSYSVQESCVTSITTLLNRAGIPTTNISLSFIDKLLSFKHPCGLNITPIKQALKDAGFDIKEDELANHSSRPGSIRSFWTSKSESAARVNKQQLLEKETVHKSYCRACREEKETQDLVAEDALSLKEDKGVGENAWMESRFVVEGMTCA